MKVLIVDDVGIVRHYLSGLLTRHNHTVATAASGDEALEILKHDNALNAVVTDLMMPGMDGIELFKAARQIGRYDDKGQLPPLEFILITALRPTSAMQRKEASLLQRALDIGFVDVMLKPVDNDRLIQLLAKIEAGLAGDETEPEPAPAAANDGKTASETAGKRNWWEALEELRETTQRDSEKFESQLQVLKATIDDLSRSLKQLEQPAANRV